MYLDTVTAGYPVNAEYLQTAMAVPGPAFFSVDEYENGLWLK